MTWFGSWVWWCRVLLGCGVLLFAGLPASAGDTRVTLASGAFTVPIQSMREARFSGVVLQRFDFSCGSAATATLLSQPADRPVSEKEVFVSMWNAGDQAEIRRKGFSLLDIKKFLATRGLPSDGFRVGIDKLVEVGVPVIAMINLNGYRHFVVVKGIRGDSVLVGDPAIGLKVWKREQFEAMWNGIAFAIRAEPELAKANFNRPEDWKVQEKAPVGSVMARDAIGTRLDVGLPVAGGGQF